MRGALPYLVSGVLFIAVGLCMLLSPISLGTLAMARTNVVDSATAQFFINLVDNDFLNYSAPVPSGWGYCVFGKVVEGMDVVDKIAKVKTKSVGFHENVPTDMVLITGASRFE